jgi:hypothetical protein
VEVDPGLKKIDEIFVKALRQFCAVACHESRSGCLLRAGRRLFSHLSLKISSFGAATSIGGQYLQALDRVTVHAMYGPLCLAHDLERLCTALCTLCTDEAQASSNGAPSNALSKQLKRLERLLAVCNATLPPAATLEIAHFFKGLFWELSGRHAELGLAKVAVDCLIAFLMHHGGNMYNQLTEVRVSSAGFELKYSDQRQMCISCQCFSWQHRQTVPL